MRSSRALTAHWIQFFTQIHKITIKNVLLSISRTESVLFEMRSFLKRVVSTGANTFEKSRAHYSVEIYCFILNHKYQHKNITRLKLKASKQKFKRY